MSYRTVSRNVVQLQDVYAREGWNSRRGRTTGIISSLVSASGNPVTAIYAVNDLGKAVADASPIAYLESVLEKIED
jgi:hypothetical protein